MLIKTKAALQIITIVFSIFILADFSNAEQQACCEKTLDGDYCLNSFESKCDANYNKAVNQDCSQTQFCGNVCCIDKVGGSCSKNVPFSTCVNNGNNRADPKASCGIPECDKGCCQIGSNYFLDTEQGCKSKSKNYPMLNGVDNFDESISDETSCLNLARQQEEGCCVNNQQCTFTTKQNCEVSDSLVTDGSEGFYSSILCSSPSLKCSCVSHAGKQCFDDAMHWVDSCGNKEEKIEQCNEEEVCKLDKNGEAYCGGLNCEDTADYKTNAASLSEQLQTAEKVLQDIPKQIQNLNAQLTQVENGLNNLEKTDSSSSPNIPSEKDNLESRKKTIKEKLNNLNKKETDLKQKISSLQGQLVESAKVGGHRSNGESWCIYEGPTGDFRDYPGTRHYRHYCFNGEEYVEPCREYREEVCLQGSFTNSIGEAESSSRCLQNSFSSKNEGALPVNISTVPLGLRFWESYDSSNKDSPLRDSGETCKKGNLKCKVTYAKSSYFGDWECVSNCACEKQEIVDKAVMFCKSQGDCGADLNVEQELSTSGLKIKWRGSASGPRPKKHGSNKLWEELKEYGVFGGMQTLVEAYDKLLNKPYNEGSGFHFGGTFDPGAYSGFIKDFITTGFKLGGPAGVVIGSLAAFGVGMFKFFTGKYANFLIGSDTKTKTLTVKCNTYIPPLGGDNCSECTKDSLHECTEYKCRSLGTSCKLVNEGSEKVDCVDTNPNDINSPIIMPWKETLSSGYEARETGSGYSITPNINPFNALTFGIKTDEPALCKYDNKHTANFDEMENDLTDYFAKEHNISVGLIANKKYRYFVRCQDNQGNENANEYEISFETTDEPDLTPPLIMHTSLPNNAPISFGANSTETTLYLNEPARCKWSKNDKSYSEMEGASICDNEPAEDYFELYECDMELNNIKDNSNNQFYFRCQDLANNTNQQSYELNLRGTDQLTITNSGPSGTIFDANPTLKVTTVGGAENGKAKCSYTENNFNFIEFFQTNSNTHLQQLKNLLLGSYYFNVICRDAAGNEANSTINFIVNIDNLAPKIEYIYKDSTNLHVITNEDASCEYSPSSFSKGNGAKMNGQGKEHTLLVSGKTYYIICYDEDENSMPLTKIVTP